MAFCPTGGIDAANALALPCPAQRASCVGGSWVAPAKAVEAGDWETVSKLAAEAAALDPEEKAAASHRDTGAAEYAGSAGPERDRDLDLRAFDGLAVSRGRA